MTIKLTPHGESLLRDYLSKGHYRSPEEAIEHALEILAEREIQAEAPTSILQLQGLGKEIWRGIDAQVYVDQERAAWNG